MARGSDQATAAATTAANLSSSLEGQAGNLYSTLAPQLETEAAHPAGFAPNDLAAMNTAAQQSSGGSQAAAVGMGALRAARLRNAGAGDAAVSEATRNASRTLSEAALNTQAQNAALKEKQRQEGLTGLEGLYGEDLKGGLAASGQIASDVNADSEANKASWEWAHAMGDLLKGIGANKYEGAGGGGGGGGGCWIAEAIYGVDDPRTFTARVWLNGPFRETLAGNVTMSLYLAVGQQVAAVVRRSSLLRWLLKPIFDIAVRKGTHG